MPPKKQKEEIARTVARSEDKTIQITFTIPKESVKSAETKILEEIGKDLTIAGFRKGKAPLDKVKENTSREKIIERILSAVLLPELSKVFEEENIKPVVYPKFELISIDDGRDWQVRVVTCEMPEIDLGDYKKELANQLKPTKIWTPDKNSEEKKEDTKEEKETKVLEVLPRIVKVKIPKMIIDEDVETKLSQLLERLEKLGITLEKYLESIGKSGEELRKEYEKQVKETITLEIALTKIGNEEKITVEDKEVEDLIQASARSSEEAASIIKDERRKEIIRNIILRRKALDFLVSLV